MLRDGRGSWICGGKFEMEGKSKEFPRQVDGALLIINRTVAYTSRRC
jgi:hypothetical protein